MITDEVKRLLHEVFNKTRYPQFFLNEILFLLTQSRREYSALFYISSHWQAANLFNRMNLFFSASETEFKNTKKLRSDF